MTTSTFCQQGVFTIGERARYQQLRARLEACAAIEELENGYALSLPGDDAMLAAVTEWAALERRCCPFLAISITTGEGTCGIRIALTGDPEAKDVVRRTLVNPSRFAGGI
jgi:hypothetical protein